MDVETEPREDGEATVFLAPEKPALEAVESADTEASAEAMSLLTEGVPLALLADLASPGGPRSPEILEDEGLPEVAWWDPADQGEAGEDESEAT